MEISSNNTIGTVGILNANKVQNSNLNSTSFDQILKNAVEDVNKKQVEGYEAMRGIATGEVPNLQEAVYQITKAESTLKLGLEVKNKALGAFKEIMRMQV